MRTRKFSAFGERLGRRVGDLEVVVDGSGTPPHVCRDRNGTTWRCCVSWDEGSGPNFERFYFVREPCPDATFTPDRPERGGDRE